MVRLFLVTAFQTLISSYVVYFSFVLCLSISVPIAFVRTYQALYKNRIKKTALISTEIAVESLRIVQYILYIAYGTNTSVGALFSAGTWKTMFAGVRQLEWMPLVWDLIGYLIVFGIYNVLLFAILRKSTVQQLMAKINIRRFELSAVRTAIVLAYKNLFLIPVSIIYLFYILNVFSL